MRKALESLPWVGKAEIDYDAKQATVSVDEERYEPGALVAALEGAGFGGKLAETAARKQAAPVPAGPRIAFKVSGMKKTRSGAT